VGTGERDRSLLGDGFRKALWSRADDEWFILTMLVQGQLLLSHNARADFALAIQYLSKSICGVKSDWSGCAARMIPHFGQGGRRLVGAGRKTPSTNERAK
jgi:hypothetical protein